MEKDYNLILLRGIHNLAKKFQSIGTVGQICKEVGSWAAL